MIVTTPTVIAQWHSEAEAALEAAQRAGAPELVVALASAGRDVAEAFAYLSDTVTRLAGVLLASAVNATPGGPEVFRAGLAKLAQEVAAQQAEDLEAEQRGEPGYVCPLPQEDGQPFRCGCPPIDQCMGGTA